MKFRESALAHKYCKGKGIEIGGSAHNPAHDIHYGLEDNKLRTAGWREPIGFNKAMRQVVKWEREQTGHSNF